MVVSRRVTYRWCRSKIKHGVPILGILYHTGELSWLQQAWYPEQSGRI